MDLSFLYADSEDSDQTGLGKNSLAKQGVLIYYNFFFFFFFFLIDDFNAGPRVWRLVGQVSLICLTSPFYAEGEVKMYRTYRGPPY